MKIVLGEILLWAFMYRLRVSGEKMKIYRSPKEDVRPVEVHAKCYILKKGG